MEDRLDSHLETLLKSAETPCRIFNAGIPGWGTLNETMMARANFSLFDPDTVVLVFCANDPSDDTGQYKPSLPTKGWIRGKTFLRRHFHLYRLLLREVALLRQNRQLLQNGKEGSNTAHFDAQAAVLISEREWSRTLSLIRDFHQDLLRYKSSARLLLVATAPESDDVRTHLNFLDNGRDLLYLDLWPQVSALPPEDRRLPYDGHWSPAMHKIAAQRIYDAITTR